MDIFHDVPMIAESRHSDVYEKLNRVLAWVERGLIPWDDAVERMEFIVAQGGGTRCGQNMVKVID